MEFDISKHELVPEHTLLTDEEKSKILEQFNTSLKQMPSITIKDPAIQHLEAKPGDMIKIKRKSETTEESTYYRVVIHG